jgi:hypothetical protein
MKSEGRNPKAERIPKSKIRSRLIDIGFGLRASGFIRHSGFGIRIWTIACFTEALDL